MKYAIATLALAVSAAVSAAPGGQALNNNPNLATLADQIEEAKITGSCGEGSYVVAIDEEGVLVCETATGGNISGILTAVSASVLVTPGSARPLQINCPAGSKATGGGGSFGNYGVAHSYPLSDLTGWMLKSDKIPGDGTAATLTGYVICLQ